MEVIAAAHLSAEPHLAGHSTLAYGHGPGERVLTNSHHRCCVPVQCQHFPRIQSDRVETHGAFESQQASMRGASAIHLMITGVWRVACWSTPFVTHVESRYDARYALPTAKRAPLGGVAEPPQVDHLLSQHFAPATYCAVHLAHHTPATFLISRPLSLNTLMRQQGQVTYNCHQL